MVERRTAVDLDQELEAVLWTRGSRFGSKSSRQRLAAALALARLNQAEPHGQASAADAHIDGLLDRVAPAAAQRNYFLAWQYLQEVDRLQAARASEADQAVLFLRYKAEAAEKLSGWRRQAADGLVARWTAGTLSAEERANSLVALMQLVHEAGQNQQLKIELIHEQSAAAGLLLVLGLALTLVLGLGYNEFDWIRGGTPPALGRLMADGALIGLLGALLSLSFALTSSEGGAKIPQMRSAFVVQGLRALVGAAAALPVVLLFHAGLLNLGSEASPKLMIAACFLAGFSERWFIARLDAVMKSGKS